MNVHKFFQPPQSIDKKKDIKNSRNSKIPQSCNLICFEITRWRGKFNRTLNKKLFNFLFNVIVWKILYIFSPISISSTEKSLIGYLPLTRTIASFKNAFILECRKIQWQKVLFSNSKARMENYWILAGFWQYNKIAIDRGFFECLWVSDL